MGSVVPFAKKDSSKDQTFGAFNQLWRDTFSKYILELGKPKLVAERRPAVAVDLNSKA